MPRKSLRKPWIMRLPGGLREQPAWVFIGLLIGLAGLGYVTGLSDSSIKQAIGEVGLRVWGTVLMLSGFAVTVATVRARPALEKLALRVMSICMLAYMGWLLTIVDFRRAAMSLVLVLVLVGLAEIRIGFLKLLLQIGEPA